MHLTVSFEHCFSKFKHSMKLYLAPILCYHSTHKNFLSPESNGLSQEIVQYKN